MKVKDNASEANPEDLLACARFLAQSHRENDPGTVEVIYVPDPSLRAVRLIEFTKGVQPLKVNPKPFKFKKNEALKVPFASEVILLNPEEKTLLKEQIIKLPRGWSLGGAAL